MKTRVIAGVIGTALVIALLFLRSTIVFPLAVALVNLVAVYELLRAGKALYCRIAWIGASLYAISLPLLTFYGAQQYMQGVRFICLVLMFLELVMRHAKVKYQHIFYAAAVMLLVPGSFNMVIEMMRSSAHGLAYVILALSSAWIADTGAYFAGTFLGKHKLCPQISPKKTVEGLIGGIAADLVVMLLFGLVYSLIFKVQTNYWWLCLAAALCALVSVLGDLSASILKRQRGIKDYGTIIPGHGGIMDRCDSVLFTVPTFYALILLIPIFS